MFRFLKCVAQAILINAPKALLDALPFGGNLCDVARDAFAEWSKESPQADTRRADVQELATASAAEVKRQAEQAVAAVAADQPEALQLALVQYLTHLPGTVRRSLSRPDDLAGTTVSVNLALDRPEDLLPLLPSRRPHPQLHAGRRLGTGS
jgi:hypothetical protein